MESFFFFSRLNPRKLNFKKFIYSIKNKRTKRGYYLDSLVMEFIRQQDVQGHPELEAGAEGVLLSKRLHPLIRELGW